MSSLILLTTLRRGGSLCRNLMPSSSTGIIRQLHQTPTVFAEAVPANKTDRDNDDRKGANEGPKLDPFGIEDVVDHSPKTLVEGYFEQDWSKVKSKQDGTPKEIKVDSEQEAKFKIYNDWIRRREEVNAQTKASRRGDEAGAVPSENYRPSAFGMVRLDSDNEIRRDERIESFERKAPPERRPMRQEPKYSNFDSDKQEGVKKMSAYDYVKNFKKEVLEERRESEPPTRENSRFSTTEETNSLEIEKPISPARNRNKTQDEKDKEYFAGRILGENAKDRDAKAVPKVYLLPEFNKLTHDDMWNILKGTVVFSNQFVFAINKPAGVPIHSPGRNCRHHIVQFLDEFAKLAKCEKIYPLHRLDKETTGVLLFAKEPKIASHIIDKFGARQIDKKYLALIKGRPSISEGTIKIPIGEGHVAGSEQFRSVLKPDLREYDIKSRQRNCKEAITHFRVLGSIDEASFVEVKIDTGVKHQIRLHLGMGLGCPVIGDHKYSHRDRNAPQRLHPHVLHLMKVRQSKVRLVPLHLHCSSISFTLPEELTKSSDPVYIHANVPYYFNHTLRALRLKH